MCSKYSDNKFIDKDTKSKSDALSTSSVYSSIPSLSGWKKCRHKREQPARAFKGKLWQATKDGCGSLTTQPVGGPNSTKENEDNYNALQSVTVLDSKPAQLQIITVNDLVSDIIQVSPEDNNPEEEAFENIINEADRETKTANCIKQRYRHISI